MFTVLLFVRLCVSKNATETPSVVLNMTIIILQTSTPLPLLSSVCYWSFLGGGAFIAHCALTDKAMVWDMKMLTHCTETTLLNQPQGSELHLEFLAVLNIYNLFVESLSLIFSCSGRTLSWNGIWSINIFHYLFDAPEYLFKQDIAVQSTRENAIMEYQDQVSFVYMYSQ